MTPEQWRRCKRIFHRLVDLPEQEREEKLRRLAPELQAEVRRMIEGDQQSKRLDYRVPVDAGSLLGKRAFEPELTLLGRFRIVRFLGAGGMGEVYEAYDVRARRKLAIKTIIPALALDPAVRARFAREVDGALTVTHRNVCRIYDIHRIARGGVELPFFTMELLEGETLHARLARDGRLPEPEARRIASDICSGLAEAHRSGIIHRDLKPLNIMLVGDGDPRAVVMDFGVAKNVETQETALTREQAPRTDFYASPEVLDGRPASRKSDLYALGLILYEMVTGRRPFEAESTTAAVLMRITRPAPSPATYVRGLPRRWILATESCLERDSRLRIDSAEAVAAILNGASPWLAVSRFVIHRRRLFAGGFAAALIVAPLGHQLRKGSLSPGRHTHPKDRLIVLGDGTDAGEQKELGQFVHNLLGIALEQSRYVRRVPDATVDYYRSKLPPEDHSDELARIAANQAAYAVVRGRVRLALGIMEISLSVEPLDGRPSMTLQEHARDLREVPAAIDRLGSALRAALGEPEEDIRANRVLLEKATTSSASAMELYSQAVIAFDSGDQESALARWNEAVRVDPDFAMAYMQQALTHSAMRREAQGLEAIEFARRLRERLSARQQKEIDALYRVLIYDYDGALRAYHELAAVYPADAQIRRRLAHLLGIAAQPEKSIEHATAAVQLDPHNPNNYSVLASALALANRPDEVWKTIATARAQRLDSHLHSYPEGVAFMLRHQFGAAREAFRKYAHGRGFESVGNGYATRCLVFEGNLDEACEEFEAGLAVDMAQHDEANEYLRRAWLGQLYAALGRRAEACAHARALAGAPALPSGLFALRAAALISLATESPDIASRTVTRLKHVSQRYPSTFSQSLLKQSQGIVWHLEGRATAAAQALRDAHALWPDIPSAWSWGEHHLRLSRPDEAVECFSAALANKGVAFRWDYGLLWLLSLERSARCRAAMRDWQSAVQRCDEFLKFWGTQDAAPLSNEVRRLRSNAIKQENS